MEPEEYEKMFALEDSHWFFLGKRAFAETFLRMVPQGGNLKILDVGCGTGGMSLILHRYGEFYGVDYKEEAVYRASKRGFKRLILGSALYLPFSSETFDLVVAFDLLYHKGVDDKQALKELYRVCKKGGYLLITESAFNFLKSDHDIAVHTRERYSKKILGERVSATGFRIIRSSYTNFFLFPIFLVRRLYKRYFPSKKIRSDLKPINPFLNKLLLNLIKGEAKILENRDLPFGFSLICLARRI